MLKSSTLFLCCISLTTTLMAQNLVPNPSFENIATTFCGIMNTSDFEATINDWTNPSTATPDLHFTNNASDCYNHQPTNSYSGPIGIKGEETPRTGEVMAGIGVYTIEGFQQREYIQIQLAEALVIGKEYKVAFYVSLADYTEFYIDKLGVTFTETATNGSNDEVLALTPQITSAVALNNADGWTLIEQTFTASASYRYLIIGNFNNDTNTTTTANPTASGGVGTYGSYYFVDDVSVEEIVINSVGNFAEADISLAPNPVQMEVSIHFARPTTATITLFNLQGISVAKQALKQTNNATILVAHLPAGIYLMHVNTAEGQYVERLVID